MALRLSEAQKRAVACPTCHASAGTACRSFRRIYRFDPVPDLITFGGPPDLDRAHDARRAEALRGLPAPAATAPALPQSPKPQKIKPRTVTVRETGKTMTLAPRVETGLVPCTGEAHSNAFIDNCMICAPRWGQVMSYAPLTPAACQEGFAVAFNDGDQEAFKAAEKAGTVKLVSVETKSSSFFAWVATGCVIHTDCVETPALGQACAAETARKATVTS